MCWNKSKIELLSIWSTIPYVMISGKHSSPLLTSISIITLSSVLQNDAGNYICSATNRHKTVSETCRVDIGGIG